MTIVPVITTVAGNGTPCDTPTDTCGDGGLATSANLNNAQHVTIDSAGNLYISDNADNRIRTVTASTGVITTIAGNGTQCANTTDACGDGGPATSANLYYPNATALDSAGNLYIVDRKDARIRKVAAGTGIITTVAGNGTICASSTDTCGDGAAATNANLNTPIDIAVDTAGNLYIADDGDNRIRKVTASSGIITTVAGNGTICASGTSSCGDNGAATSANLYAPRGVLVDSAGDIYISDNGDDRVRVVEASNGNIYALVANGTACASPTNTCGDGGSSGNAELNRPGNIVFDHEGNGYVGDQSDNRVRMVSITTGNMTTVAGTGTLCSSATSACGDGAAATSSDLNIPIGVAIDAYDNLYIADSTDNRIRKISFALNFPVTAVGSSVTQNILLETTSAETLTSFTAPQSQGSKQEFTVGTVTGCTVNGSTSNPIGTVCTVPVTFTPAYPGVRSVSLTVVSGSGTIAFGLSGTGIAPLAAMTPGVISTVAGTGTAGYSGDGAAATSATLDAPQTVAIDNAGNLYIADETNNRIRKVNASAGTISTVAGTGTAGYSGDGGAATSAEINAPWGIALDAAGNLYIADHNNYRIRKVNAATGNISTIAGNGTSGYSGDNGAATSAEISQPRAIALDSSNNIYFADAANNRIRKVNAVTGVITTVAGNGTSGFSGDGAAATSAEINSPAGVQFDSQGNLYIADKSNARIRLVSVSTGYISTVAGNGTAGFSGDGGAATSAELNTPTGIAFDSAGNLYIADEHNDRIRTVNLSTGIISTIAGNGTAGYSGDGAAATSAELDLPVGLALDSAGNLYIADSTNDAIRKITVSQSKLTFPTPTPLGAQDTSDDPLATTLTNIGNSTLTLAVPSSGNNPAVSSSFTLDSATTCPELTTASSAQTLASGSTCTYAVDFDPTTAGSITGSVVLTDNSLGVTGATQTITLAATAAKATPTITWSNPAAISYGTALSPNQLDATASVPGTFVYSPASGTVLAAGSQTLSVTFTPTDTIDYNTATASVTLIVNPIVPTLTFTVASQTYGVAPFTVSATSNSTGAITYSVVSGPATVSGSTVTLTGIGTVILQASQAASGNFTAATQNATFTVSKATPTVTLASSSNPSTYGTGVTFTATVPTSASGTVTFLSGGTSIGSATLSSGTATLTTATLTTSALTGGSHSITAQYNGDSNDNAATSSTLTQTVNKASVSITLASSENPSLYGDLVTFTFAFTGAGPAIPTGTAAITSDGSALATVTLSGAGAATYSTSALTASAHTIRAVYNGDGNYQ